MLFPARLLRILLGMSRIPNWKFVPYVCLAVLAFAPVFASAQDRGTGGPSHDIGVTGGGYFAVSNPTSFGAAWAMEGSYAQRLIGIPAVSLSAELPVAGSFTSSIPTIAGTSLARSYTSLFITPGVRVRLAPSFFISPYFSAGFGYARFNSQLFSGGSISNSTTAFDIGGGLDIKVAPYVSLRGEIRDFNSGGLGLQTLLLGRQNNLFVTAGMAVRF
jgi:opacity protein-like surface antigen